MYTHAQDEHLLLHPFLLFLHISCCKIKRKGNVLGSGRTAENHRNLSITEKYKNYSAHWHCILNLKGIKEDVLQRVAQLIQKRDK